MKILNKVLKVVVSEEVTVGNKIAFPGFICQVIEVTDSIGSLEKYNSFYGPEDENLPVEEGYFCNED